MFDSPPLIVGLEIGTSKICAVVGEFNEAGELNLIGIGQAPSRGVRKGEIVDGSQVAEDVRKAIVDLESSANVEVRSVYLGVSGSHVRCFTNRGLHTILSAGRGIAREDVDDVVKNARVLNLPPQNRVLHAIRQHFAVDGQEGIVNPIGMPGSRLEVDVHVIHGLENRFQNSIRVVESLQLSVEGIAFNGLASALALLGAEEKEMGSLVIDIGGGTTEYVVYANGIVKHAGALAVGGDHITNDLVYGLKVPPSRAESLKVGHGSALMPEGIRGATLNIESDHALPPRSINLEHLHRIMAMRVEEIFQLIELDLHENGLLDYVRAGVFLCGGSARIPRLCQLAENMFQVPATVGYSKNASGNRSTLESPEFVTAIGLVKFGSFQEKEKRRRTGLVQSVKETVSQMFRRG